MEKYKVFFKKIDKDSGKIKELDKQTLFLNIYYFWCLYHFFSLYYIWKETFSEIFCTKVGNKEEYWLIVCIEHLSFILISEKKF